MDLDTFHNRLVHVENAIKALGLGDHPGGVQPAGTDAPAGFFESLEARVKAVEDAIGSRLAAIEAFCADVQKVIAVLQDKGNAGIREGLADVEVHEVQPPAESGQKQD